ncbi:phosphodiesterase/alkaline phosphatase D [Burkholderiales bacterium JOSHI_001]|nr:phosphodiesterase/alkaline phosphatase D [Burkholderiales bacterium JOSHI_001]
MQQAGGAAMALGAVPLLQACGGGGPDGSNLPTPAGTGLFRHGVASGDPLADRVILWTRVTPADGAAVAVQCTVATDAALTQVVKRVDASTDASRDHTLKLDVTGLAANTSYYYQFSASESGATVRSPLGRTRTLPSGSTARLRLAVLSCSDFSQGFFNVYRRVAERADLDLVVHLGDFIYERGDAPGNYRAVEPATSLHTLADYRMRHALHKRDPDLQDLHRQHPMVAMWDDHDIASDANVSGSTAHNPVLDGPWPLRVATALQAYMEWMPLRVQDAADLRRSWRSFAIGNLVDFHLLETRVAARSPQLPGNATLSGTFRQRDAFTDSSREMLGAEQHAWLAARLRASTARWKFIAQGVQMSQVKLQPQTNIDGGGLFMNADQWDGYQPARDRLFSVFKGDASHPAVGNVVVLSGDAHASFGADLTPDPNNGDTTTGGYDENTGAGSIAVEFVTTSVTSPFVHDTHLLFANALKSINPHLKFVDLSNQGYLLIDADATRVVGEWWFVDTVTTPSNNQSLVSALQVLDGSARLVGSGPTSARTDRPGLAP